MCSALPCDSDWRTQTKVYLEIPAGNMKRIGLNRFCKRHMSTSRSVVQFYRFWGYVRNILVCQKGGGGILRLWKYLENRLWVGSRDPDHLVRVEPSDMCRQKTALQVNALLKVLVIRHLAMPIRERCFLGGFPCVKYADLWSIVHFWTIYFCRLSANIEIYSIFHLNRETLPLLVRKATPLQPVK